MCGIAGTYRLGPEPIEKHVVDAMLVGIQHRGTHATGVALMQESGKVVVCKNNQPAWQLISSAAYKKFMEKNLKKSTRAALLHTRFATKGSPSQNKNNHPMFDGKCAVVHNGHISNDDHLFKEMKLSRSAETDSDIIRAIVAKYGLTRKAIPHLNKMSGACAAAIVHSKFPKKLMLLHSGSPLCIAVINDEDRRYITWASERGPLYKALRPWTKSFGFFVRPVGSKLAFSSVHHNSAWLIGEEGVEWHDSFSSTFSPRQRVYVAFEKYEEKRTHFKREDERRAREERETAEIEIVSEEEADLLLDAANLAEADRVLGRHNSGGPTGCIRRLPSEPAPVRIPKEEAVVQRPLVNGELVLPEKPDVVMCPYHDCRVAISLKSHPKFETAYLPQISCPKCFRPLDGSLRVQA